MGETLEKQNLPDTGISGVYEVILGTDDAEYAKKYFADFGFQEFDRSTISAKEASRIYGVDSKLTSYRLQNGKIDSHGLLRILEWEKPLGKGIGYAPVETIGSRIAVMRTHDIFRLYDIYKMAREEGKKLWLPTEPIADDLFGLNTGERDFFNRPIIVRENAVYGQFFNHIFFQRYGYVIPGYGTIEDDTPLKTSEFTHHDFIIDAESMEQMSYLSTALGLKAEEAPALDGDWLEGPKRVFQMEPGFSHVYQGFVSPNNICGKMKFFIPNGVKPNKSKSQRIGEKGITLHSFYTPKLNMVHELVSEHKLNPTQIVKNEFEERSFLFSDTAGVSWQIIERNEPTKSKPATKLEFKKEE
ncbi:hypothetical protein FEE95_04310 [Maribacter algarum]|uniref:Glyoxalase n=1 Tax=Maribacter algarum (ex Zhang et al. 2020) TaxID=2578118 RepID=A0A5S3PUI0_9FLAO|nr:hypothetical protein [Maribacter algarum]TMM58661.1 hypothetical protein FEE95_04310 [Maribacter algarum]